MPDLEKMTVQSLRELARKVLGPGHSRLKTKAELVSALQEAGASSPGGRAARPEKATGKPAAKPAARARAAATRAAEATSQAVKAVKARAAKATRGAAAGAPAAAGKKPAAREGGSAKAAVGKAARAAGKAVKAAAAAAGSAVEGVARTARKVADGKKARAPRTGGGDERAAAAGLDPDGFFVARVRGEEAVRGAPHPLTEGARDQAPLLDEGRPSGPVFDERLGELPWGYADDAFVALPRDPRTLFLYWDLASTALEGAFQGLDQPRAQLWLFARAGAGWERVRVLEFALESRGYYVHDLEPGRVYRAEIHAVDRQGQARRIGRPSNEMPLPPVGPSPVVDDRFARIPWDLPLGRLFGPGHAGGPFSDEARAMLSRLSDWSRFSTRAVWGGSAGEAGDRPSSPTSAPSSPSSPAGGFGPREK